MAVLERAFLGDFDVILEEIEKKVVDGNITGSLEGGSDFYGTDSRCSIRVFERWSAMGGNRVSLTITMYQDDDIIHLSAITAGGSKGMVLKINRIGEDAFLRMLNDVLDGMGL